MALTMSMARVPGWTAPGSASAPAGVLVLLTGNGIGELFLGHLRAAADAERCGTLQQFLLGAAEVVHAAVGVAVVFACPGVRRPGIGRALVAFLLPVVADLLELVLERRVCDPVRAPPSPYCSAALSCALANVSCASFGERCSVPGSSSLRGSPVLVVFGMMSPPVGFGWLNSVASVTGLMPPGPARAAAPTRRPGWHLWRPA